MISQNHRLDQQLIEREDHYMATAARTTLSTIPVGTFRASTARLSANGISAARSLWFPTGKTRTLFLSGRE